jgi:glycosyltransferase involved in cell wall biosynthesis
MRWLVLSPYLPHRRIGHGGGTCVYQLCQTLTRHHETALLCFQRHGESGLDGELRSVGVDVHTVPLRSAQDRGLGRVALLADRTSAALRAWMRGRPLMVEKYQRSAMREALAALIAQWRPQVLQIEYGFMAPYGRWALERTHGQPDRPHILLNTHELVSLVRLRRLARLEGRPRVLEGTRLGMWSRYERDFRSAADEVLCVTEQDRVLLAALSGAPNLRTVPLGIDGLTLRSAEPTFSDPPRILFVGSFGHPPNRDAARLLVQRILPAIWDQRPHVHCDIIGRDPPAALSLAAERSNGRLQVHGYVEDLEPYFRAAWLFAAPLFSGGGIKIKILEALGRGAPVLSTPIGLEGIETAPQPAVASCEREEDFAPTVLRLLNDPDELRRMGESGREVVLRRYTWEAIVRTLGEMVNAPSTGHGTSS